MNKPSDGRLVFLMAIMAIIIICSVTPTAAEKKEGEQPAAKPISIQVTEATMPTDSIYVGEFSETLIDPYCVEFNLILQIAPQYKEMEQYKKNGNQARYWILLASANDFACRQINNFAREKEIRFICRKNNLFNILKKQLNFESKTKKEQSKIERDLTRQFDLTTQIIKFNRDYSEKLINSKEPKGLEE